VIATRSQTWDVGPQARLNLPFLRRVERARGFNKSGHIPIPRVAAADPSHNEKISGLDRLVTLDDLLGGAGR
jgi:hypothetical protein